MEDVQRIIANLESKARYHQGMSKARKVELKAMEEAHKQEIANMQVANDTLQVELNELKRRVRDTIKLLEK